MTSCGLTCLDFLFFLLVAHSESYPGAHPDASAQRVNSILYLNYPPDSRPFWVLLSVILCLSAFCKGKLPHPPYRQDVHLCHFPAVKLRIFSNTTSNLFSKINGNGSKMTFSPEIFALSHFLRHQDKVSSGIIRIHAIIWNQKGIYLPLHKIK